MSKKIVSTVYGAQIKTHGEMTARIRRGVKNRRLTKSPSRFMCMRCKEQVTWLNSSSSWCERCLDATQERNQ